ncbi:MAG: addiction module toxin RelE [Bacteroidetes bacterium 4484_276]|nr:MAG: addiction module toxin RelE [Bacteroidetes bacterium 4484_276]OYT13822.1 MAG: addiction module toxin RelE [Bacteroidetes bacterium 4572_114]
MDLIRKDRLLKLKRKNQGNVKLSKAIDKLIGDIESSEWKNKLEVIESRPDADRVHSDNFFFFDIYIHRVMILIAFNEHEAEIIWVGDHADYDSTFKGNKRTIETWLRNHGKIK